MLRSGGGRGRACHATCAPPRRRYERLLLALLPAATAAAAAAPPPAAALVRAALAAAEDVVGRRGLQTQEERTAPTLLGPHRLAEVRFKLEQRLITYSCS